MHHGIGISLSTLKRDLVKLGLRRKNNSESRVEITEIIRKELLGSSCNLGRSESNYNCKHDICHFGIQI